MTAIYTTRNNSAHILLLIIMQSFMRSFFCGRKQGCERSRWMIVSTLSISAKYFSQY